MNVINAIVRNGRVETDEPIDLPDGTELRITLAYDSKNGEGDWDNLPEEIERWLEWYDSLQPLRMTPEEEAESEAWLKRCAERGAVS
jgi:hypothetical protein